jgi:hypothetical protein
MNVSNRKLVDRFETLPTIVRTVNSDPNLIHLQAAILSK